MTVEHLYVTQAVQWCEKQLGQESVSALAEERLDCVCKAGERHAERQGRFGAVTAPRSWQSHLPTQAHRQSRRAEVPGAPFG